MCGHEVKKHQAELIEVMTELTVTNTVQIFLMRPHALMLRHLKTEHLIGVNMLRFTCTVGVMASSVETYLLMTVLSSN